MAQIITIPVGIIPYYINLDLNGDTVDERVWSQQYDTETRYIVATIWNNGIIYPLTTSHTINFVCTKPKTGFGINNEAGIDTQGRVVYIITDQTTAENGRFKAEFRIYDALTGKVGTPNFNMYVEKSALSNETIISTPEVNVLTELILEATEAISGMEAVAIVESNRVTAENIREVNENGRKANEINRVSVETARDFAENTRNTAENTRKTNETTRGNNETTRGGNETNRISAESSRVAAEIARNTQETTRQSNETTRQSQETTRQNYYNAYKLLETYNNTKAYVVGNKVIYQGSTYQNKVACTGVLPINTTNWIQIAAKGQDGAGGDMFKNAYDPQNKAQDVFAYVDNSIESKFDATSQIAFTEATTDTNITSGETIPTSFGKLVKSIKTFRTNISTNSTNIGTLSSLTTTVKTSLVNAINELVTKINELVTNKINVSDIINNDTTGGTNKVASAETVKVLGQEVDANTSAIATINNNLATVVYCNEYTIIPSTANSVATAIIVPLVKALAHNFVDVVFDTANGYVIVRGGRFENIQSFNIGNTLVSFQFVASFTSLRIWKEDETVINFLSIIHEAM